MSKSLKNCWHLICSAPARQNSGIFIESKTGWTLHSLFLIPVAMAPFYISRRVAGALANAVGQSAASPTCRKHTTANSDNFHLDYPE
jgi:hypothetical protein